MKVFRTEDGTLHIDFEEAILVGSPDKEVITRLDIGTDKLTIHNVTLVNFKGLQSAHVVIAEDIRPSSSESKHST